MKKKISIGIILCSIFFVSCIGGKQNEVKPFLDQDIKIYSKVNSNAFEFYDGEKWQESFVKGVNIGAAKPGYFPGELGITKDEYLRWFEDISNMNANTIRVYTILKPEFYEALYEYNCKAENPLYLMHGVWLNEDDILDTLDAYNPKVMDAIIKETGDLIDVLHGNAKIKERAGHAFGTYTKDVSPYVSGLILGIEWDPYFVMNTDEVNGNLGEYDGEYLYTENASPFERFLCVLGDFAVKYETENYNTQVPISFTNWVTTDMLEHSNEPSEKEDLSSVNTEHIKHKDSLKTGLFASYHIYPYYPDFMNYQKEYINYIDNDGKINTYKAYLLDLIKEHTIPVIVAEFGVPSSRGKTHTNVHMGYDQGYISEKEQGIINSKMLKDIYDTGYAGGLVFTWQDEWFKRTWNNMDYDMQDRRAYWSNAQTNEQQFGLLAFDPGEKKSISYVDGDTKEWKSQDLLANNSSLSLYCKSDERNLYLMVKTKDKNIDISKEKLIIPFDVTNKSGSQTYKDITFTKEADFVLEVDGTENTRLLVQGYYDVFYYQYYKQQRLIAEDKNNEFKETNQFNPIYLCLNKELYLPEDKVTIPFEKVETGKFTYGNGNPKSDEYNSLADFIFKDNVLEIKIPWQLLNVMDPSSKMVMDDLYEVGIEPTRISNIKIGVYSSEKNEYNLDMSSYTWENWDSPKYHERLKDSYYILQEAMHEIDK